MDGCLICLHCGPTDQRNMSRRCVAGTLAWMLPYYTCPTVPYPIQVPAYFTLHHPKIPFSTHTIPLLLVLHYPTLLESMMLIMADVLFIHDFQSLLHVEHSLPPILRLSFKLHALLLLLFIIIIINNILIIIIIIIVCLRPSFLPKPGLGALLVTLKGHYKNSTDI